VIALSGDVSLMVEELMDNACKFSAKGNPIEVRFEPDGVLTVIDAGRGMTLEEIEQVGLFQQFDRKKQEQQGLGLGLALVKKLSTKCGAKLLIESEISKSTTVKIAFQLAG
jgi:two-component system, sensor histidine kinase and response regulator